MWAYCSGHTAGKIPHLLALVWAFEESAFTPKSRTCFKPKQGHHIYASSSVGVSSPCVSKIGTEQQNYPFRTEKKSAQNNKTTDSRSRHIKTIQ